MQGFDDFIIPYLIVQGISWLFLFASSRRPRLGRMMFALLFLYAAVFNMQLYISNTDIYLMVVASSLPVYSGIIEGWLSNNHHVVIPVMAIAQFLVGTGLLLHGRWVKCACIGAIVFLAVITPVMDWAWFPFSIILSVAVFRIIKRDHKEFIWVSTAPRKLFSR